MVNLTPERIVFNRDGEALDTDIRAALKLAADTLLSILALEQVDMVSVSPHKNTRAVFAKFAMHSVLSDPNRIFGQTYAEIALEAYRQKHGHLSKAQFSALMFPDMDGPLAFKRSYANSIHPGIGLFLLALHSSGAITLPAAFHWPSLRWDRSSVRSGRRIEVGRLVTSELLTFIRSLDSQSDSLPHPAFVAVGGDRKRKEWFLTYATKLLLVTGWHKAEDVNLADLFKIKAAERIISPADSMPFAYRALLDVLKRRFGERVQVTVEEWGAALRAEMSVVTRPCGRKSKKIYQFHALHEQGPRSDHDLMEELLQVESAWGRPERMRSLTRLPGLEVDIASLCKLWVELEVLYMEKTPRESYSQILGIFGWWNIYLFYYLPYWFARNPTTRLTFPACPSLLLKSAFVSRLLPAPEEMPVTFIEFMNRHSEHRSWNGNSYYGNLLQLQGFFEFIERNSEELRDCDGFKQPLSAYDYPRTSRPKASRKQPIPRRFFGIYLDYHEALIAHHDVVTSRILSGELHSDCLKGMLAVANIIDTFATVAKVGFVPVLFTRSKTIPLRFIPNVLEPVWRTLKDGRSVYIPHPHSLHQNLVALHTGIRHNHIQWLDRDKFDSLVDDDGAEFAQLFVNTDKKMNEPWAPHVSMRVIELLRAQRDWSDLIGEQGFHADHYYNNNLATKWPKFRPLFAYASDGRPHSDKLYSDVWQRVLCGLQGLLPELEELGKTRQLLSLLPPGCRAKDPDLDCALKAYGARFGAGENCRLNVMTAISPHSARVAVVSQYITFLPTDLIGAYITGQKPGVVQYYVHLDKEVLEAEQVHQAMRLREAAFRNAFEPVLKGQHVSSSFIHADRVNSNLAKSMQMNLDETLVSYGCISISFSERSVIGVDVLRETRGAEAVANKTEICPYGNNCPPEVVKEWRGLRRCSLCHYAVRSIDHLPAIVAKKRQVAEVVDELEALLSSDAKSLNAKYTPEELDRLEEERARLCEELTGWILNEEILELTRQRISQGQENRKWIVPKPEIIEQDLQRVIAPTSMTEYLLGRLGECIAYPAMASPQIRARFDLLRRELLARAGKLRAAFSSDVPVDPAAECAGLLKAVIASTGLDAVQLAEMLEQERHLLDLPSTTLRLLSQEVDTHEEA